MEQQLPDNEIKKLIQLKQAFPFRVCFAVEIQGEYRQYACFDRRKLKGYVKKGYPVFIIGQ